MSTGLTHLDRDGNARMVDVAGKSASRRSALAAGRVRMSRAAYDSLRDGNNKKGDVLAVARIAGIQAAKRCSDLIPLCHPLALEVIAVDFNLDDASCAVDVLCRCALTGKTGVEMEALTGASVAALTIYDMCKAIDKGIEVEHLRLLEKTGGKSGGWRRDAQTGLAGQETPRAD